jgi:hypothetical protein
MKLYRKYADAGADPAASTTILLTEKKSSERV